MAKKLYVGECDTIPGTCGVGYFADFYMDDYDKKYNDEPFDGEDTCAGCGWNIAGFINNATCEECYKYLVSKYPVKFQSPIRTNDNSSNKFFMCVFDMKGRKPVGYKAPKWPFNKDTK